MLDALGGQPPEWWIFAEDGESIMPDNPGTLLYGECTPAVANGAIARLRPHSARSVREDSCADEAVVGDEVQVSGSRDEIGSWA